MEGAERNGIALSLRAGKAPSTALGHLHPHQLVAAVGQHAGNQAPQLAMESRRNSQHSCCCSDSQVSNTSHEPHTADEVSISHVCSLSTGLFKAVLPSYRLQGSTNTGFTLSLFPPETTVKRRKASHTYKTKATHPGTGTRYS